MAAKSHYFEGKLLEHMFKGVALPDYSDTNDTYLALFTDLPSGDTPPSTEVTTSGSAYARQALKAKFASSSVANQSSGAQISTSAEIAFSVATSNWGNIQSMCVMDAVSGGNVLYYATFTQAKQIYTGDQLKIASGSLTILED